MKLQLDTRINMIMFKKRKSNTIVMSADLNMKFSDYLNLEKTPRSLNKMLRYNFKKGETMNSFDSLGQKIKLTSYTFNNNQLVSGFIEVKYD